VVIHKRVLLYGSVILGLGNVGFADVALQFFAPILFAAA
jgi:hypothetical protein